jgi:hypothetical protein
MNPVCCYNRKRLVFFTEKIAHPHDRINLFLSEPR